MTNSAYMKSMSSHATTILTARQGRHHITPYSCYCTRAYKYINNVRCGLQDNAAFPKISIHSSMFGSWTKKTIPEGCLGGMLVLVQSQTCSIGFRAWAKASCFTRFLPGAASVSISSNWADF